MNKTGELTTEDPLPQYKHSNGRRRMREELESTWRVVQWNRESPMLRMEMAPRAKRRARQGKNFKPVYGYLGPSNQPLVFAGTKQ